MSRSVPAAAWILLATTTTLPAENWPQWRGPAGNNSSAETGLPESCAPDQAKWTTALPGPGHSTPAIWGEHVFLTSTERASKGLLGMCLSASDGRILWQKRLGDEIRAPQNNGATPSPVTDGKAVGFLFGSGDLAVLDFKGGTLWSKSLVKDYGNLCTKFGYSSSPFLDRGVLYIQLLRRSKPYSGPAGAPEPLEPLVIAFDFATGKELWKVVRKSSALDESLEAYTTPMLAPAGAGNELIILGGDCLTGHDPASGKEHWRIEYNPNHEPIWRVVPSPAVVGDLIVAAKPRGGPMIAIKTGSKGDIAPGDVVWTYDERTSDSGSPLVYQNLLYILQSDKNDPWSRGSKTSPGIFLLVVDPASGKELGRCKIASGGAWRTTPTGADGKIYLMSEDAEVVVVSAGANGRILSRHLYDQRPSCASLAIANGHIFIRTAKGLTCIGGK